MTPTELEHWTLVEVIGKDLYGDQYMTHDEMQSIVTGIEYKDWEFVVLDHPAGAMLQLRWNGENWKTGEQKVQKSRKWYVSPYMTEGEIVQTALLAVKTAEEHEIREEFKFNGRRVFGPHLSIQNLWDIADIEERRE